MFYGSVQDHDERATYFSTSLLDTPGQNRRVILPDRVLDVRALRRSFPAFGPDARDVVSVVMTDDDSGGTRLIVSPVDGADGRELLRPTRPEIQFGLSWADEWIYFARGLPFMSESTNVDVWRVRSDGTQAANLTPDSDANDAWPDASPLTGRVVFRSGRDGNYEIYIMDHNGARARRLTEDAGRDTMPAISPDGDLVAFSSNRDGEYQDDYDIYLLAIDDDGEPREIRRITQSLGPDMHVRFSPDATWIVYASQRGGFNDEPALSFSDAGQTYGELYAQRLDDGHVVRLTHDKWEDGPVVWGK